MKFTKIILIIFMLVEMCSAQPNNAVLRGVLKDSANEGIPFTHVQLFDNNKKIDSVMTDIEGSFMIRYNSSRISGKGYLAVSAHGYLPATLFLSDIVKYMNGFKQIVIRLKSDPKNHKGEE